MNPQVKHNLIFSFHVLTFLSIALVVLSVYYFNSVNEQKNNSRYSVVTNIYEDIYGNVIKYPQIADLSDEVIQDKVNNLLLDRAIY